MINVHTYRPAQIDNQQTNKKICPLLATSWLLMQSMHAPRNKWICMDAAYVLGYCSHDIHLHDASVLAPAKFHCILRQVIAHATASVQKSNSSMHTHLNVRRT